MEFKFRITRIVTLIFWWVTAISLFQLYKLILQEIIGNSAIELLAYPILASYPVTLVVMSVVKHEVILLNREVGIKLINEGHTRKVVESCLQKSSILEILLYDVLWIVAIPVLATITMIYIEVLMFMIVIFIIVVSTV